MESVILSAAGVPGDGVFAVTGVEERRICFFWRLKTKADSSLPLVAQNDTPTGRRITQGNAATLPQKHKPLFPQGFAKTLSFERVAFYALKDDPQPQVLFTFGLSNLNPAPSRVS